MTDLPGAGVPVTSGQPQPATELDSVASSSPTADPTHRWQPAPGRLSAGPVVPAAPAEQVDPVDAVEQIDSVEAAEADASQAAPATSIEALGTEEVEQIGVDPVGVGPIGHEAAPGPAEPPARDGLEPSAPSAEHPDPEVDAGESGAAPPLASPTSTEAEAGAEPTTSEAPAAGPHLRGAFERYEIGDPGRAFDAVISRQDRMYPWTPDTIVDGVTIEDRDEVPRLEVRAASVRGLSHRHSSKVRQDNYAFAVTSDQEHLVAIVADGVSAGPHSHTAATLASRFGCNDLRHYLSGNSVHQVDWVAFFQSQADRMTAEVTRLLGRTDQDPPPTVREVAQAMASTIIIGIVELVPLEDGSHTVHVLRLGDTSGWIIRPDRRWEALGDVKNEGATIAESATVGLPFVPEVAPPLTTTQLAPGEAFVLMTDGIGDPLGSGRGEVGAALAEAWSTPPPPIQFAAQIDFGRKSFDDDRTALAVWPSRSSP